MKVLSCTSVFMLLLIICFAKIHIKLLLPSYLQFQLYYDCFVLLYFGICLYQVLISYTYKHKNFNVYSNQSGIFQCLADAPTSYLLSSFRSWIKHLLNKKYLHTKLPLIFRIWAEKKLGITFEPSFRRETYSVIA